MSNKLAFIVDDSQQYLSNQVKEIMESWEFQNSEYKTVFEWKPGIANVSLLFGKTKAIHLDLSDTNNLNKFVDFIKDDEKKVENKDDTFIEKEKSKEKNNIYKEKNNIEKDF